MQIGLCALNFCEWKNDKFIKVSFLFIEESLFMNMVDCLLRKVSIIHILKKNKEKYNARKVPIHVRYVSNLS